MLSRSNWTNESLRPDDVKQRHLLLDVSPAPCYHAAIMRPEFGFYFFFYFGAEPQPRLLRMGRSATACEE